MSAQRILKEARPLFWPWCAIVLVGALPLVRPVHLIEWTSSVGLLLGIPLLATLPLGNEFQHRTLPLLLSQPAGRMRIWGEKMGVTLAAVLSAALIFALALWSTSYRPDPHGWAFAGAWLVATTASATFWTLLARSTIGGIVLNVAVAFFISLVPGLIHLLFGKGDFPAPLISPVLYLLLGYAGVMLWLGGRTLARFQATGGMVGDDLLMAGPDVLPGAWAGWLRCRPSGAVLNLIRKELRLLRPVWLISLLAALGWACLALFGLLHERGLSGSFVTTALGLATVSTLTIAILAGAVPLGEERTSGTHMWHLTLPVSARLQWFIKLCTALFAAIVGAWLVPLLIAGRLLESSRLLADVHVGRDLLVGAVLLSLASFWCACAVNGTVPAALWVPPVMIVLFFALGLGWWLGPAFTDPFFVRFDPSTNENFVAAFSRLSSTAFFKLIQAASTNMTDSLQASLLLAATMSAPMLLYAAIQSYRLFRVQVQARALPVLKGLPTLAMLAFLCSFASLAFYSFVSRATENPKFIALFETLEAVERIQSRATKLDAAHPLQLTVEDLAKASPLSKSTRRLLGDSRITLALDEPPHHGGFGCAEIPPPARPSALGYPWYSAIIPLADGSHFFVAFDPVAHYTISVGICK